MNLAYFHAPWCGVCHEKSPVVERIAADAGLTLEHWDIENDAGRTEAESRRIKTVPTLALIHGDRVPFRLVGSMITPENAAQMLARFAPPSGAA
jgi:protein-disulfide isomerase-like protein with CxxC motif